MSILKNVYSFLVHFGNKQTWCTDVQAGLTILAANVNNFQFQQDKA